MKWGQAFRGWVGMLLLIFAFAASPADAKTALAVCVMPATPSDTASTLFAHPERFDCTTPQDRFGPGSFWVLSEPLPRADAAYRDLNARIASLWQNAVTLHVLYADGHIASTGFTSADAGRRLRLGPTLALPLPAYDAPPVRLLWHVEGAANLRGVLVGATLARDVDLSETEMLLAMLYGAFAGMAIALIIYNLALWRALRKSFQPAYCVLVLCLLGYAISSSGALGQLLPEMDNNVRLRINAVLLAASAIAAIVFARAFFETRVFDGWLRHASDIVIASIGVTTFVYVMLAPWQLVLLDRFVVMSYLLLLALVGAVLVRAWRSRSSYLWLFALAWGAPIGFAGLRIASAFHLVAWNFWLDHSTIVSMMLEALLSSLAIAYRILLLSRERDDARVQEAAARLLADTDPLTGLLNRRAFLARGIGRDGNQTLLIVDIDHFKRVNETIGHDGGDEVLRVVARALRAAVPPDALVARIGGEEFAIITHASSWLAPEAVLAALRRQCMPFDIAVTASIGTCTGPLLRETDWKRLYCDADRALFAAKAAGRDRSRDAQSFAA
jgi:diguanylate cyclase (GGDEF)-like protein